MKQNQDKLSNLKSRFTLDAKKIAEICGFSKSWADDKKSAKKTHCWFKDDEIEKLKDYLIAEAEELKKSRDE